MIFKGTEQLPYFKKNMIKQH